MYGTGAELIFLGDLIDRAPEVDGDIKVVRFVKKLQDNPKVYGLSKVTVLKGNHEDFFLRLKTNSTHERRELWHINGGDPAFYTQADPYLPWLDSLPLKAIRGNHLFVHAGVKPGVPLNKQKPNDMLWIREEFLNSEDHGLDYTVVHGHTVMEADAPVVSNKRVACDLGLCFGGPLGMHVIKPDA